MKQYFSGHKVRINDGSVYQGLLVAVRQKTEEGYFLVYLKNKDEKSLYLLFPEEACGYGYYSIDKKVIYG